MSVLKNKNAVNLSSEIIIRFYTWIAIQTRYLVLRMSSSHEHHPLPVSK